MAGWAADSTMVDSAPTQFVQTMGMMHFHRENTVYFFRKKNISFEAIGPIQAEFHMEPLWIGEKNVWSNSAGHMAKMAVIPIYGKNILFSRTEKPGTTKLDMKDRVFRANKIVQIIFLGQP